MTSSDIKLLLFGHDTVQCAYNLGATESCGIDFERLAVEREAAKLSKSREPTVIDCPASTILSGQRQLS